MRIVALLVPAVLALASLTAASQKPAAARPLPKVPPAAYQGAAQTPPNSWLPA
jgi:hypothetical protein